MSDIPIAPRSLAIREKVIAREGLLDLPSIAPLVQYVSMLRRRHASVEFPNFDPLDAGVHADVLFLFEKPGPMTSRSTGGSGFISRDNDDPTAEATFRFMIAAGVPRTKSAIWNVVPGWNGTRKVTQVELAEGVTELAELLPLMANLHTIVLVGEKARRARHLVCAHHLHILESAHPSPLVRASWPERWNAIPMQWSLAASK